MFTYSSCVVLATISITTACAIAGTGRIPSIAFCARPCCYRLNSDFLELLNLRPH
ncbi:hypothetical protein K438DRAFT_1963899 [Mycena galopus ATCC 62051]|nr:hypothetical protein K438DRAFT_1963899 [Mycena galopus ATCC 62051]